jgi:hypothetical protein
MPRFNDDDLIELSLLRGLEIDCLVSEGLLSPYQRFDSSLLESLLFTYNELVLTIHTGDTYPASQLSFEVVNLDLPRLVYDSLRIALRIIIEEGAKVNNADRWMRRDEDDAFGVFEFEMSVLKLVQKTNEHLDKYRKLLAQDEEDNITTNTSLKFKNDGISKFGIDLSTVREDRTASSILGKSIQDICQEIPDDFRVLHVESIIRNDLYRNFLKRQNSIRESLQKLSMGELRKAVPSARANNHHALKSDELAELLVTPKLTYHGTQNSSVPSIVKHGFLAPHMVNPGTGQRLGVRCGRTYGSGIYSSPNAQFALYYSGQEATPTKLNGFWGMKLIVCATIMGRSAAMSRGDCWLFQTEPYPGADSHVGNNQLEYIVFDNAQILPCYVIHLDWGEDNINHFKSIPDKEGFAIQKKALNPQLYHPYFESPGDKQRNKEALIAKASKYFPYGYGPATGASFVVEEVGEVDEDEEEYGQYQKDRIDEADGKTDIWEWDSRLQEANEHDEYIESRVSIKARKKI